MAIVRKKIKISELFEKFPQILDENTMRLESESIKVKTEEGFKSIESLYKTDKREISELILEDGFSIKAVPEHRVMTNNDWKYLKNLNISDLVQTIDGYKKVISVNKLNEKENCYDLQVEDTHSYFGNGILNHNTEMFLSLCKLTNVKTLILFARIDLAHQTLERVKSAGLDAGIVQGANIDENHQIVMATVQSGHKLNNLEKYDMVIVDETHRASSPQYKELLSKLNCRYRFGFSATPFGADSYKSALIRMWLGGLIYEVDPQKLLDEARIAVPTIRMIPISYPENITSVKWPGADTWGIIKNSYRNKIIVNLAQLLEGRVLILVKSIEHGDFLNNELSGSIWLSGSDKSKIRREAIKNFDIEEKGLLIASTIMDEGIDLKNVQHIIIAGGGSSYVKVLQRIGRGTRVTATKKTVDIYDFYDSMNEILEKHSITRMKHYKKEKFTDIRDISEDLVKKLADKK